MSSNINESLEFIRQLAKASSKERKTILKNASIKNLKDLSEICLNLLQGKLKINHISKNKLRRHRQKIETLANKKVSLVKKKRFINQKGNAGFLLPLASIALPLVANLISKNI